jgi:hypothetical protein
MALVKQFALTVETAGNTSTNECLRFSILAGMRLAWLLCGKAYNNFFKTDEALKQ